MHCWRIQIPMEVLIPATLILSRKSNDSSGKPLFQLSYGEFISLIHLIPVETYPKALNNPVVPLNPPTEFLNPPNPMGNSLA